VRQARKLPSVSSSPTSPPTPRPRRAPQYQTGTSPLALQMSYISQHVSRTEVISWPDIMRNILNGKAALISLSTRRNKHYVEHKHLPCRHLRCHLSHLFYCSLLYRFFRKISRGRETYMRHNVASSLTNSAIHWWQIKAKHHTWNVGGGNGGTAPLPNKRKFMGAELLTFCV